MSQRDRVMEEALREIVRLSQECILLNPIGPHLNELPLILQHAGAAIDWPDTKVDRENTEADLRGMDREHLIREVQKLRNGIRADRDSSGHDLCWWRPELWGLLPEKTDPDPAVPDWDDFLHGCIRYRSSLRENP